jgi:hypothetical protein
LDADTFVSFSELIANGVRKPITRADAHLHQQFVDLRGTAKGAKKIPKLAMLSTYLAFGVGVALAAPLPSYIKCRRKDDNDVGGHLTETAVFNFSGRSSSGKSSICLAAMSLAGSPERAGSLDFTPRGLAEAAKDSNDLLLVLDDTEKAEDGSGALVKALKHIVHMVPGGKSKMISRGVDQTRFPTLRWSTFGLSSSPRPIRQLAEERRWAMSPGDKVRLFNIAVPRPEKGGIFDRIPAAANERAVRSVKLIAKLEQSYINHHGHIIPEWIQYLLAKDKTKRILRLVEEFIEHVAAGKQGWEARFARKFGYIYAAMALGVRAGLLPWPKDYPSKVAVKCYRRARESAKTTEERADDAIVKLATLLSERQRVVTVNPGQQPTNLTRRCIAIRYHKQGRLTFGVLDQTLLRLLGSRKAKSKFTKGLVESGLIASGHGHAGTVQEHIRIVRDGKIVDRPWVWAIDVEKFYIAMRKRRRAKAS